MNGCRFAAPQSGRRDDNCSPFVIHRRDQASDAALLPVFTFLLLLGGDVGTLHHNDSRRSQVLAVIAWLTACENAVADLQILHVGLCCIFQIFLSRSSAHDSRRVLNYNGGFGSSIGRQCEPVTADSFNRSYLFLESGGSRLLLGDSISRGELPEPGRQKRRAQYHPR